MLDALEGIFKNEALPPARVRIHSAPMALRPPDTRRTNGGGGRQRSPSFLCGVVYEAVDCDITVIY